MTVLQVEETTLESLVWRSDSPVWEAVKQSGDVPSVEEVSSSLVTLLCFCWSFFITRLEYHSSHVHCEHVIERVFSECSRIGQH